MREKAKQERKMSAKTDRTSERRRLWDKWVGRVGRGGQEEGRRPEITHIPVFELPITPIARIRSQGIDQCSHCPLTQFLDLLYQVNRTIMKTNHA